MSQIKKFKITSLQGETLVVERLREFGLHEGVEFAIEGQAPLKGPLYLRFGSAFVALRKEEFACLQLQTLN